MSTADGEQAHADVLVLATGLDAQAFTLPMSLTGPTGATLEEAWNSGPRAHNTTMVPGLPNLFLLVGPISPIHNSPLMPIAEAQAAYVVAWLYRMRDRGLTEVEPTQAATDHFYQRVVAAIPPTIWTSGSGSGNLGPDRVPMLWPWQLERFQNMLAHPDFDDFHERHTLTHAPEGKRQA